MHFPAHADEDRTKELELARHGDRVVETGGKERYHAVAAWRRKYNPEPWYKDVHGDFLFFVLPLDKAQINEQARKLLFHTPFRYEPMPVLRASTTAQLWVLGGDDLEAPSAATAARIK